MGDLAGQETLAGYSVAIGYLAGQIGTGTASVAVGSVCGNFNQGAGSVAIGDTCGESNQGQYSVAIGNRSGRNSQGSLSVAIGNEAGDYQLSNTIAIGNRAALNLGASAFQGVDSIAIGTFAQYGPVNATGPCAIAIGFTAGYDTQASNSIAIGTNAGKTSQSLNSIAIGNRAGEATMAANTIVINATGRVWAGTTSNACYITPVRAAAALGAIAYYSVTSGELTYNSSSRRYKNTIQPLSTNTSIMYDLSPMTYMYNNDPEPGPQIGYIAEEVAELNPKFATYCEPGGPPESINWNTITVFMVEEMKKLKTRVTQLETLLATK
jgi:hypothetical protein